MPRCQHARQKLRIVPWGHCQVRTAQTVDLHAWELNAHLAKRPKGGGLVLIHDSLMCDSKWSKPMSQCGDRQEGALAPVCEGHTPEPRGTPAAWALPEVHS
jgi:hypothetical protein